jgi:predicted transcriptional regulator
VNPTGRVHTLPILIAFKVIALAEDLSAVERQVGATLLDSFNRKTGQCDPSLDRVASLLNVHRRTVIRATAKLEARGLFRKTRHGGYSHRNHYEPIWSKFRDLENKWRSRFGAAARARRTGKSSSGEHASHDSGDADATQTSCTTNLTQPCRKLAAMQPTDLLSL